MCTHGSDKAHGKSINSDRKKRVALFQTLCTEMSIDGIVSKLVETNDVGGLDELCLAIAESKTVHFHVLDEGQFREETEFVTTGINNPINVPVTEVDSESFAVMYPTKRHIDENPVPGYRSFRIKGKESFSLVASLKGVAGVIVQGKSGWVAVPMEKICEYRESYA